MISPTEPPRYCPAIICAEHHSPIDALLALCVPQHEAQDLVSAYWHQESRGDSGRLSGASDEGVGDSIHANLDGGRAVVAVLAESGRWLACNAFPDHSAATPAQARHALERLLKRGRRGCVVCL